MRKITITWPTDDGDVNTFEREMDDEECIEFLREIEGRWEFEAVD